MPGFPPDLPISEKREEIATAVREHQVVVICGETGSGKTTQIPKICLAMGRGRGGMIGHTQPRRIAARSVAARIADELNSPLGKHVGYKIRFSDTLGSQASVKVMTDGILLAETRSDPLLRGYDTLIIDEAHERSLNIDFLLGYIKRTLPKRPDLKVIITSATIDPRRFSDHFGGNTLAPFIEVSGRVHPVEVRYRPLISDDPEVDDRDLRQGVLDAVREAFSHGADGDILVFLSGEREIRDLTKALGMYVDQGVEVLPLYARLTTEEQNRIFAPRERRRIVLATNVAETSLTVPGIRYVIDSGRARMSRYSARSGVQRLPIEPISKAAADQRKGRCGRLGPGVCFRLYSQEEYEARDDFTPPEILRTNLASVILQMKALRLGRIEDFPFVEPPRWGMITDGYSTLHELGALDEWGEITPLGEQLSHLPIDPRLGRMILAARDEGCVNDVLVIAAALSVQDPRHRPHDRQDAADEAHRQFRDEESDFITLLNLWRFFQEQSKSMSQSRLRRLCGELFLSYVRMREWIDVHHQLRDLIAEAELVSRKKSRRRRGDRDETYGPLHRAIVSGLLSRIGVKGDSHEYVGAHGRKFHIFPGSGLFARPPQWIVAASLVETTKTYAHTVARISPKWIEQIASHLVKRRYAEPHWREQTADVGAFETVTLFGLEIVRGRRVAYGRIDPKAARDIFIQNALVESRYKRNAPFSIHNRGVIEDLRMIESKTRRRGVLVHDAQQFAFFDSVLPPDVYDAKSFERWRRTAERRNPTVLFMSRELLATDCGHSAAPDRFPESLQVGSAELPLEYHFEPGHENDGITVIVPLAGLHQLSDTRLDWLVPGALQEKVASLIRSLPKSVRRHFVPAAEYAAACTDFMTFGEGHLLKSLAQALRRMSDLSISPEMFNPDELEPHLRMNVRVVNDEGNTLAKGRSLGELRGRLAGVAMPKERARTSAAVALPRGRFTRWAFDDLPPTVLVERAGISLTAYPAIVDAGDAVTIQALDTAAHASRASRRGLRRLIMLQFADESRAIRQELPYVDEMAVNYAGLGLGGREDLVRELLDAVFEHAFLRCDVLSIQTSPEYDRIIESGWHNIASAISDVTETARDSLHRALTIRAMLMDLIAPHAQAAAREIRSHLATLVYRGFIAATAFAHLREYPRYLEGIRMRITKITSGKLDRDRQLSAEFEPLWQRYLERAAQETQQGIITPALEDHRWMLEELRIAMFAQELGTRTRISSKRLEAHWHAVDDQ